MAKSCAFLKSSGQELSESVVKVSGKSKFTRLDVREQWMIHMHYYLLFQSINYKCNYLRYSAFYLRVFRLLQYYLGLCYITNTGKISGKMYFVFASQRLFWSWSIFRPFLFFYSLVICYLWCLTMKKANKYSR